MTTYRTIQGDTWDSIAYKVAGTETFMTDLMLANLEHIETVIFPAGVTLNIPDIKIESAADTLPPWRADS
ncbi:tail protein X [Paenibacillus sp. FSL R5-0527]|uniref:tail protein X n=1 Tax=Paenibacillus sp. FSL R5-0527 TaxID=2975321 RepID=UPI000979C3F0|nr:phage tail protein [Paenibacillus macerans]